MGELKVLEEWEEEFQKLDEEARNNSEKYLKEGSSLVKMISLKNGKSL